jgi:hypothetical protein
MSLSAEGTSRTCFRSRQLAEQRTRTFKSLQDENIQITSEKKRKRLIKQKETAKWEIKTVIQVINTMMLS